jgi:hypothetical protein
MGKRCVLLIYRKTVYYSLFGGRRMRQFSLWIYSMNVCYQFFTFDSAQRSASYCHKEYTFTSLMNPKHRSAFDQ